MGKFKTTQALASSTGGATFPFARLKGLEDAIQKLSAELHSQYVLSFMPEDASPGYHALKVQVGSGAYQIRARPGYWSTQGPGR